MSERAIAMAKATLKRVLDGYQILLFVEIETCLLQVAAIFNQRPIAACTYNDDDFDPVVPRDLLLGKPACCINKLAVYWDGKVVKATGLIKSLEKVREFVSLWWRKWMDQAVPLLAPRRQWRQEVRLVKVGDIVMVVAKSALGPGSFQLARIEHVHPDVHGVVRTVTLAVRNRRRGAREAGAVCRAGTESHVVPVQRIAVLAPVEETWGQAGLSA